jgi:hypothetical protein
MKRGTNMRSITRTVAILAAILPLARSAMAADLSGAEIKELISDKTVFLELAAGTVTGATGTGIIYYSADGTVLYKTGKGEMWHGTWTIKDNLGCVIWKETPNNACTRYDKQGDVITLINVATGQPRGKIIKTAPGNSEKLAP